MSTDHRPTRIPAPTTRPRVLHVITRLGLGGSERVALEVVRSLCAESDFAVFAVHGADGGTVSKRMEADLAAMGVPWFRGTGVPMKRGGMVPAAIALARSIRVFRPDIIHFHSETPESCGAMMHLLFPGTRHRCMVRTIHNSVFWRYWPRIGRWCDRRLAEAHVACVSHAARDEFRRYRADSGAAPLSVDPVVIPNGVAIIPRPPRCGPADAGVRRIVYAGRFEPQKGTDVLARALPLVSLADGVRGELVFVGDGSQETLLRNLAGQPPKGWSVAVRSPVGYLPDLLSEFDLLVVPSRFEGLPLVPLEAILCGVPVVATNGPGLREVLPPGYPWQCRPDDPADLAACLSRALEETAGWSGAVTLAQHFAQKHFSPAAMRDGYRHFYARAGAPFRPMPG